MLLPLQQFHIEQVECERKILRMNLWNFKLLHSVVKSEKNWVEMNLTIISNGFRFPWKLFSLSLFIDMDALLQMPNRQSYVNSSNLKIEVKIFQQTDRKEDEKDGKK